MSPEGSGSSNTPVARDKTRELYEQSLRAWNASPEQTQRELENYDNLMRAARALDKILR